jgi:hypothetical protein
MACPITEKKKKKESIFCSVCFFLLLRGPHSLTVVEVFTVGFRAQISILGHAIIMSGTFSIEGARSLPPIFN